MRSKDKIVLAAIGIVIAAVIIGVALYTNTPDFTNGVNESLWFLRPKI